MRNKRGSKYFFVSKKGDLGVGITGIFAFFFIVFVLIIFLVASAAIAGKIHLPFIGEDPNQIDLDELSDKKSDLELKQIIVSVLEYSSEKDSDMLNIKEEFLDKGFSSVYADTGFKKELKEGVEFYLKEDYCLRVCDEKTMNCFEIGKIKGKYFSQGCVSSITERGFQKASESFLISKEEIKFTLHAKSI